LVESVIGLVKKDYSGWVFETKENKINYVTGKVMAITHGKVDPRAIQDMARRLIA
jgi:Asp-tRNA(Asn)/Glu-tRNA(Gln) amidotransferase B subunit